MSRPRRGTVGRGWLRAWMLLGALVSAHCGSPAAPTPQPPPAPPLTITCPAASETQSPTGNPIAVTYEPPRTSGGVAPVTTACSVASGASFNIGTTNVLCSATDARGNSAFCSFNVSVLAPPRLAFTRYVAFGDSITAGKLAQPLTFALIESPFHYPGALERLLNTRYPQQRSTVVNEGVSGELATAGEARFRTVLQQHRPEVVLLMEGTNDLLAGVAGADRAIAALRNMIREAALQGRRVALATVPPQGPSRPTVSAVIPSFNAQIRALAAAEPGVVLVDVYEAMRHDVARLIGADDLHPTPQGYTVIADTFLAAIQANFEERR
jgi:lysophospholipase L1-like esterase